MHPVPAVIVNDTRVLVLYPDCSALRRRSRRRLALRAIEHLHVAAVHGHVLTRLEWVSASYLLALGGQAAILAPAPGALSG